VPTFVVGDVHGHVEPVVRLLRDAGLVDGDLSWSGQDARLWFIGDLVDRGPDGIGAIELVMGLQREGDVLCLLGNHEALLLGVQRAPDVECVPGISYRILWEANGGRGSDLARLREDHVAWLERLPAVGREDRWLLVHSDTDRYLEYGSSVEAVCAAVTSVVSDPRGLGLKSLVDALADRGAFSDPARLARLLAALGGEKVVHGHTPIWYATGLEPEEVTEPLSYAEGAALNVDHCLFAGGPGFLVELS
jgi:hypothetical protein